MNIIKKKTWPEYFNKVLSGEKKFDVRLADFPIEKGDLLILEEYDLNKGYTGRKIEKRVGEVYKFGIDSFGQKEQLEDKGFYIIQI